MLFRSAEVIKYGLIRDPEFLDWLEQNMPRLVARDVEALAHAVERSCANKADVVAMDENETGVRAHLNLGHTFVHAIEAGTGYGTWLHGEAVAAGMVQAADLSCRMGLIGRSDVERVRALLAAAGLPLEAPRLGPDRYLELMSVDKKAEAGRIRFILLRSLGEAFVTAEVPESALREVLSGQLARA